MPFASFIPVGSKVKVMQARQVVPGQSSTKKLMDRNVVICSQTDRKMYSSRESKEKQLSKRGQK